MAAAVVDVILLRAMNDEDFKREQAAHAFHIRLELAADRRRRRHGERRFHAPAHQANGEFRAEIEGGNQQQITEERK